MNSSQKNGTKIRDFCRKLKEQIIYRNEKKINNRRTFSTDGNRVSNKLKRIEENADLPALSILLKIARVLGLR